MSDNLLITWREFYEVQDLLIGQIKKSNKIYKYIVAIPCGGLMPAYFIAKALDLPIVTINIKSYFEQKSENLRHITTDGFGDRIKNQEDALIVDDIYDSGKTIKYLQNKYPLVDTAVTFARFNTHSATYVGRVLNHKHWLDFPWEVKYEGAHKCN